MYMQYCAEAYYELIHEVLKYPKSRFALFRENNRATGYYSKEFYNVSMALGSKHFNKEFHKKYLTQAQSNIQDFNSLYDHYSRLELNTTRGEILLDIVQQYRKLVSNTIVLFYYSGGQGFTEAIREELSRFLKQKYEEKSQIILSTLLASNKIDLLKKEEIDLIKLSLEEAVEDKIKQHAVKYSFLFFNCLNEATAVKYLKKRITQISGDESKEKINSILLGVEKTKQDQQKFLNDLPEELQEKVLFLQYLGTDRLELKNAWAGAEYRFQNLFKEISKRLVIPFNDLIECYTFDDIKAALINGQRLSHKEVNNRKKTMLAISGEKIEYASGQKAQELARKIIPNHFESHDAKEFLGTSASAGKAVGLARVIQVEGLEELEKDSQEFQEKEIIVTTMTQPSMTPIIAKAAAIVADEGGITSHAAVIAREFKIPCVVGTHICTKAIKTGQKIEVDGNKGLVKIL